MKYSNNASFPQTLWLQHMHELCVQARHLNRSLFTLVFFDSVTSVNKGWIFITFSEPIIEHEIVAKKKNTL